MTLSLIEASVLALQAERERRSQAIKAAQALPSYSDRSYPGRGVILCTICGKPCRDHAIGPCPLWEGRQ